MRKARQKQLVLWQKMLYSRVFFIMGCIVIFSVASLLVQDIIRNNEIVKEINDLESKVNQYKKDNKKLNTLIAYLNSPEYVELEAKKKLGLQRNGESSVIIPDIEIQKLLNNKIELKVEELSLDNSKGATLALLNGIDDDPSLSNRQLWWNYFFN